MAGGTFIVDSARRHGIGDEAIMHAYEHEITVSHEDDGLTMLVGVDVSGRFIEVGWVEGDDGVAVIVHAMPGRRKYLR